MSSGQETASDDPRAQGAERSLPHNFLNRIEACVTKIPDGEYKVDDYTVEVSSDNTGNARTKRVTIYKGDTGETGAQLDGEGSIVILLEIGESLRDNGSCTRIVHVRIELSTSDFETKVLFDNSTPDASRILSGEDAERLAQILERIEIQAPAEAPPVTGEARQSTRTLLDRILGRG